MDKQYIEDYKIQRKDFKEDNAKTRDLKAELQETEFNLDEYRNKELFYSPDLSEVENIRRKLALKEIGREFTKKQKDYEKGIIFLEPLLNNSYFENDYYIYRQLAICYERVKPKRFADQADIIKKFLKSGIYCCHNQYLWFTNKLSILESKKGKNYITKEEINEHVKYFKENGMLNKENQNIPVVLAERIYTVGENNDVAGIKSQYSYERQQIKNKLEFIGQQKKDAEDYEGVIEFYDEIFTETNFHSIKMYEKVIASYEKLGDYESALLALASLFKRNYSMRDTNKLKLAKKLNSLNKKVGTSFTRQDLKQLDYKEIEEIIGLSDSSSSKNSYTNKDKNQDFSDDMIFFKYAELYEKGLISREEFEFKKNEIFSQNMDSFDKTSISSKNEIMKKNYSKDNLITVASNNLRKLLKSNVGDEIIVQRAGLSDFVRVQITEIQNTYVTGTPENNIIKLSGDNFEFVKSLNVGDSFFIKTKNEPGKVTLKILE